MQLLPFHEASGPRVLEGSPAQLGHILDGRHHAAKVDNVKVIAPCPEAFAVPLAHKLHTWWDQFTNAQLVDPNNLDVLAIEQVTD